MMVFLNWAQFKLGLALKCKLKMLQHDQVIFIIYLIDPRIQGTRDWLIYISNRVIESA